MTGLNRWIGGVSCGLLLCLGLTTARADVPVHYRLIFDGTWSEQTHPDEFPSFPHFSPPIGGVHNADAVFWRVGELASQGVKDLAEIGDIVPFRNEILAEAALGNASSTTIEGAGFNSPGSEVMEFTTTLEFPKITIITMIACSPDWFTGTKGLDLLVDGEWQDDLVFSLLSYDAGTDSGITYEAVDQPTVPPVPIFLITDGPLAPNGEVTPVGTYTFEILDVDGLPPYVDTDGDGLTNIREAAIGTDPRLADTDVDGINDDTDICPLDFDPMQLDVEGDGFGDACDNCPALVNPQQIDADEDAEGDLCDLDDGLLYFTALDSTTLDWQDETVYSTFNLYRGDLATLRSGGAYTQDPAGSGNADRFCGLADSSATDAYTPAPGEGVHYLATGDDGTESSLGQDSAGNERPNDHPCP